MAEDWRLSFEAAQGAAEVARDLTATAPAGVSVSRRQHTVFVYGETRELVERSAGEELLRFGSLCRWHADRGWIDPAEWTEPEPVEPADWEVETVLPHAEAAKQLVRELERDGRHGRRAGKQVVIVGLTRREAERLAAELPLQVPPASRIEARPTVDEPRASTSGTFGLDLGLGRGSHHGHGHHGGHHHGDWFFGL